MKRGNYFIACYDLNDNYIRDFESIEECALYFQTSKQNINDYLFKKMKLKNKYRLFKYNEPCLELFNKSL